MFGSLYIAKTYLHTEEIVADRNSDLCPPHTHLSTLLLLQLYSAQPPISQHVPAHCTDTQRTSHPML